MNHFGNRVFASDQFSYFDRDNNLQRASLAVTAEGTKFIKGHPAILQDIEKGLFVLRNSFDYTSNKSLAAVDLGKNRRIREWKRGGQSCIHKLEVDNQEYVVKTHSLGKKTFGNPS